MRLLRNATVWVSLLGVTMALPVFGAFSATEVFLPSVGAGAGSGTSVWHTTVWVHNPGSSPVDVQFSLLVRDQANVGSPWVYNDRIQPGETARYPNALETLFGITSRTFGAIRVQASERVIVNGRIYSQEQGKEERDSTGQFFAGVPASFAVGAGERTQLLGVYQTSPQESSEYRYNFGFVEAAGADATVRVTAYDETGASVGSKDYAVRPYEPKQYSVKDLLPGIDGSNLRLEVEVSPASPGRVVAFGSGIANRSNDPSTFEMAFDDDLLAAGGVGETFSLPFQGSTSSSGPAFKVANSGSGVAVEGNSTSSWAVYGRSTSGAGVVGQSASQNGVTGLSDTGNGVTGASSSAYGVAGYAGPNAAGVYGESSGTGASGFSTATAGYNYGVRGRSASPDGAGVAGFNVATGGNAFGLFGRTDSSVGRAVHGVNNATGTWGALGSASYAFEGQATNNTWVGLGSNEQAAYMYHSPTQNTVYLATAHNAVEAFGASGVGVLGSSHGSHGVSGTTNSAAWGSAGVFGDSGSSRTTQASGVWGLTQSPDGYGGRFESRTRDGIGVALWTGATQGYLIKGYWIDQTGSQQNLVFKVDSGGRVFADHSYNCGSTSACFNTGSGADLAERIDASEELAAGDVVEIDPGNPRHFRLAKTPVSTMVAGVVSSQPAMTMNNNDLENNDSGERHDTRPLLALVGQVPVKASAENGAIVVGDLLVASSTPGHAMRCTAAVLCSGAVIGKALESMDEGHGLITMLVSSR